MSKIHVVAKRDFLESLTPSRPLDALSEIVWNGFDADGTHIQVFLEYNEIDGIGQIRVRDNGYGIPHQECQTLFGNLGESWKKAKHHQQGRALHGKNGKGRFKAFSLGQNVEWNTCYELGGKRYSYTIKGSAQSLDDFEVTEPRETPFATIGTEVVIYNLQRNFRSLQTDTAKEELPKKFAVYLTDYPSLQLDYHGDSIDPGSAQILKTSLQKEIDLNDGRKVQIDVSIVEWRIPTDRAIYLCDSDGIALGEVSAQSIRAPGFCFTAHIKSDFFRELDSQNQLGIPDLHPDVQEILKVAKGILKEHFRVRTIQKQGLAVERWKKQHIYPYEEKETLNAIEVAERQVFDILAVNVENYLPSFEDADEKAKKFTFRLLAQALRENPNSVQEIIGEVLGLRKADQDDLAMLLKRTTLSSIISSAKVVANRLDFLSALENLIFDKESKKHLLERDQLHKILEKETWIFSEDFCLSGSEERLEEVLSKHIAKLGKREDDNSPVYVAENKGGRVDLLFHKANQPRTGEYDYLIVELKRPLKKIDAEVVTQIKQYANAVSTDERFHGVKTRWTFLAVANELDSFAKAEAAQRHRPRGLISDNADTNVTVWVKEWAEVINDARARLHFINQLLSYQANRESSREYLEKTHAKYIPEAG